MRGWRLAKEKSSRKIDGVVALSFACRDVIERPLAPTSSATDIARDLLRLRDTMGAGRFSLRRGMSL